MAKKCKLNDRLPNGQTVLEAATDMVVADSITAKRALEWVESSLRRGDLAWLFTGSWVLGYCLALHHYLTPILAAEKQIQAIEKRLKGMIAAKIENADCPDISRHARIISEEGKREATRRVKALIPKMGLDRARVKVAQETGISKRTLDKLINRKSLATL